MFRDFPCLQVGAGREDVDMRAPTLLPVEDGGPGVTVFLEAGPRGALELVQGAVDLSIGRPVLGSPRQDSRSGISLRRGESRRSGPPGPDLRATPRSPAARRRRGRGTREGRRPPRPRSPFRGGSG